MCGKKFRCPTKTCTRLPNPKNCRCGVCTHRATSRNPILKRKKEFSHYYVIQGCCELFTEKEIDKAIIIEQLVG